jgi:protein-S-isoprenylcysteine O-methyltransferase Ste14
VRRSAAAAGASLFFALAPGVVAGVVPWWITGWDARPVWPPLRIAGGVLLVVGALVLVDAFRRFVVEGAGTPAPVAPTERLVVGGLFRYVRNPMYLAVVVAILGQALLLGRPVLLGYAAVVAVTTAAFVRWYEEPTLRHQFGAEYDAYRRAVPGWWPRPRPWRPSS